MRNGTDLTKFKVRISAGLINILIESQILVENDTQAADKGEERNSWVARQYVGKDDLNSCLTNK